MCPKVRFGEQFNKRSFLVGYAGTANEPLVSDAAA
jgi:hypothetical protein